jgi:methylated-DNA-protein-cysteine methyltransferase-like protein
MATANYFERVYQVTASIPRGRVTTYGAIADFLALGSARMVGWALNKSLELGVDIPAHRVVNRKGELSGRNHFEHPQLMQRLLEDEGIVVENNQVVNFKQLKWHPEDSVQS